MKKPAAKTRDQLEKRLASAQARITRLESLKKERAEAKKRSDALNRRLRKLAELSMTLSGDPMNVFNRIAGMIADLLSVPVVCLSEIRGSELYFLSVYVKGKIVANAGKCPLDVTPCATVEKSKDFRVYDYVAERFPKAAFLKKHQAFSYCGFPALDSSGKVVAVTCLLDNTPHEFSGEDRDLLQIFAQRIGFEIERQKNMTEQKQTEDALTSSEEKYRALVESTDDSIYLVDSRYRYLFINTKHLGRMGLSEEHALGRPYGDFHSQQETREFIRKVDKVFKTGKSVHYEHVSHRDQGCFLRTLSPVRDAQGRILAITIVSKHITQLKLMEERLRTLSLTDDLTGLYNRRGFMALAAQQLKLANRLKRGMLFISADLDGLKLINDTFGHKEGDRALSEIADILRQTFRDADIIARIGGDEFVVMLVENSGADTATLMERLDENLRIRNAGKDRKYHLSLSHGIAHCRPQCPYSLDELMVQSDHLMYEQKARKKNRGHDGRQ